MKLVEEVTRQLYASEIDRKDKILASMTVVSGPVTILIASVAFLASTTMSSDADYLTTSPDIAVLIYDVAAVGLAWFIVSALISFHRLLSAEYYSYLPDADEMITHFDEIANVVEQVRVSDETLFSRAARIRLIELYAERPFRNAFGMVSWRVFPSTGAQRAFGP